MSHVKSTQDSGSPSNQSQHNLLAVSTASLYHTAQRALRAPMERGPGWLELTCCPTATQKHRDRFLGSIWHTEVSTLRVQHRTRDRRAARRMQARHHVPATRVRTVTHQMGNSGSLSPSLRAAARHLLLLSKATLRATGTLQLRVTSDTKYGAFLTVRS